jgi:hypothetical protein
MYECNYDTHKYDCDTLEFDLCTQSVISTRSVARMRLKYVRVGFQHLECNFHSQSVIYVHTSVILTRRSVIMILMSKITKRSSVIYTRRVRFYNQCDFDTHESNNDTRDCGFITQKSDFDTYECENVTHKCDYDTQECDLCTHELNFNTMRVNVKRTN